MLSLKMNRKLALVGGIICLLVVFNPPTSNTVAATNSSVQAPLDDPQWTTQVPLYSADEDEEWLRVTKAIAPEISGLLKRGFTNLSLRKLQNEQHHRLSFDPIYLQENNNDVTIKDFTSANVITSRLRQIETDMLHSVFSVVVDLNNIELGGQYEIVNREQVGVLPVTNFGKIHVYMENVTASGYIGFKRNANDSLETTNYNLEYKVERLRIQVIYLGRNQEEIIRSEVEYDDIDQTLLKLFKSDLWYRVQTDIIKANLDQVLSDISVQELFLNKKELLTKFGVRGEVMDKLANNIVDRFLAQANGLIYDKGLSTIKIGDFQRSFSQSWGLLTFWGGFEAADGYASNLSTIYRTGNFSIVPLGASEIVTFGALGLREFGFNYNKYKAQIWNIGPAGDVKSVARTNSVAFRITTSGLNPAKPIKIKDFDFYIEQLDDVDVNLTGMGYPLNWLLSRAATWMYGLFKTNVRSEVERVIEQHLRSIIGQDLDIRV